MCKKTFDTVIKGINGCEILEDNKNGAAARH